MSNGLIYHIKDSNMQIAYLFANFMSLFRKRSQTNVSKWQIRTCGACSGQIWVFFVLFCFFSLNMQSSVVRVDVSVPIVQGRYFDRKRYSVIFQISVIRLNILNWACYNQLPTNRSLYVDVLRLWRAQGQRPPYGVLCMILLQWFP